jgi:hypothetical protein
VPFSDKRKHEIAGVSALRLAATMELFAYWSALRGERRAPERNDIDPGAIRGVLADTFVLDFDAGAGFPMRIAGSRANALFLKELRGSPFLEIWRESDREDMREILFSVADGAQPFLIGARAQPSGFSAVEIETMLLPLRHHGQTHARVLGSCAFPAAPRWSGLVAAGPLAIVSLRALDRRSSERASLEEAPARLSRLSGAPVRRGHLFVYSGDKG